MKQSPRILIPVFATIVASVTPTLFGADEKPARRQTKSGASVPFSNTDVDRGVSISFPNTGIDQVAKTWQRMFGDPVTIAERAQTRKVSLQLSALAKDELRKLLVAALQEKGIYVIKRPDGVMFDTEPAAATAKGT